MNDNPISNVDPDGDIAFLAAVGIGSAIGGITGGIKDGWNGAWKGALIGGIGGAAGYGAVSAWGVGGVGFTAGATNGAIGGAAGGFAGGASGAWLNGASLGQGLLAGGIGAGFGGLTGGAIGGLASGIDAVKHGGNFWNGNGASYVTEAGATIGGEAVEYSNESAREFSDKYFGKVPEVNKLYADGSECIMCTDVSPDLMTATHRDGRTIIGITEYYNGKSNVYLYKGAFTSNEQLYMVMGHEYIHARLFAGGIGVNGSNLGQKQHHGVIHEWTVNQSKAWKLSNISEYTRLTRGLVNYKNAVPNYQNYFFPIRNSRPW